MNEYRKFWDQIDQVILLNLPSRKDRYEAFMRGIGALIPPDKLYCFRAVWGKDIEGFGKKPWFRGKKRDNAWASRGGCSLSHSLIFSKAQEEGWKTLLILEDDIALSKSFSFDLLDTLAEKALSRPEWDFLYLGFTNPREPHYTVEKLDETHDLVHVYGAKCTHAYLARVPWKPLIAQLPHRHHVWEWVARHVAVDRYYQECLSFNYTIWVVTPSLIVQEASFSDLLGKQALSHEVNPAFQIAVSQPDTPCFEQAFAKEKQRQKRRSLLRSVRFWKKRLLGF